MRAPRSRTEGFKGAQGGGPIYGQMLAKMMKEALKRGTLCPDDPLEEGNVFGVNRIYETVEN